MVPHLGPPGEFRGTVPLNMVTISAGDLLGKPTGEPGALPPGEDTEDRGDLVLVGSAFSLHLLQGGVSIST